MTGSKWNPTDGSDEVSEDLRLMQLVGSGDTKAFEELIERHQRLVMGTAVRMLGNNSEAEDIAQQVFVRVWKNARRYTPRAKFTTWLLKITRNLVLNELRRRSRQPQVPIQIESADTERPMPDTRAKGPDSMLLEQELRSAVEAAIGQLPEAQRMAIVLRRYQDCSYEQIGEVLGLTVPAVKSLLFRARTELRSRLGRYLAG